MAVVDAPARAHPLASLLAAIRGDLERAVDELRWATTDAWWKRGRGLDAPRGASLSRPVANPADPDQVDGPKYDLGIGDDRTRRALVEAVAGLARAELELARAVLDAGHRRQPPLVRPTAKATRADIDAVLDGCTWRLDVLDGITPTLDRSQLAVVRRRLRPARKVLDDAVRTMNAAFARGSAAGVAHAERPCRVCGIRPQATREAQVRTANGSRRSTRPSKGGRCNTCATYFERNGSERPRELDGDAVSEAKEAARRRRDRGEGWGAA